MKNSGHLNSLDHMACNKIMDDLHENENLGTAISASSKRIDTNAEEKCKSLIRTQNNMHTTTSNGSKPGLTELSNDKTYLETELSFRKRIKTDVEFFNKKNIQKQYALSGSDTTKEFKSVNFVKSEKYFCEELNILTNELNPEKNSEFEIFSETDLNTFKIKKSSQSLTKNCDSPLNTIPYTKPSSNSITIDNVNWEEKSHSKDDIKCTNEDSSDGKSSETLNTNRNKNAFDIEIEKCYELLHTNHPKNKIKDNKLASSSDISISSDVNHCLEILKMEKNNSESELSSKSINNETVQSNIKFAVNPPNQEEHSFQNKILKKDKIPEVQSFDKDVNTCRKVDTENVNKVEPKFIKVDDSTSSIVTSISDDKNGISCTKNEFGDHCNKSEEGNTKVDEQNKCVSTSDEKLPLNEDDLLAYSDYEISILESESLQGSINGEDKDSDDDYEVSLLEDDTVFQNNTEISNKEETESDKGLSVEIEKSTINSSIHVDKENKAICLGDSDDHTISKEVPVHCDSFNKMLSVSNEISNNNIKELNTGNKLEERISFKNIAETIDHKSVQEYEKSANYEEIKENVVLIPDYYEDEKEDLINPGWNKIKELSNDEERYRQVRDCWKSASIPNPNKNLTYHSFRKRHLNKEELATRVIKQHKRQATSNLNNQSTKRSRLCTYAFDNHIQSKIKEKELKTEKLQKEFKCKVNNLNDIWHQQEVRLQGHLHYYGNKAVHTQKYYSELEDIRRHYQQQISTVTNEYHRKFSEYDIKFQSGIEALEKNRNEVFQFYTFYKGLQNEQKDPTILTNDQLQELNEIENIYQQLDHYYK